MGILGLLFNENKRKWYKNFTTNQFNDFNTIIKLFFIEDNINYEKYMIHEKWDKSSLSSFRDEKDLLGCSSTFRKFYAEGITIQILHNSGLGYCNWFYYAYPDVANWFESNLAECKSLLLSKGFIFNIFDQNNLHVLRQVVIMYKSKYGKLELSI